MVLLQLVLTLLIATTTADRIVYLPPPNSVDDYIRVDFPSNGSPTITEVTIAAWVKPTTMTRGDYGYFFSYMSSTDSQPNMLLLGGKNDYCSSFGVKNYFLYASSCRDYNITDGKSTLLYLVCEHYISGAIYGHRSIS